MRRSLIPAAVLGAVLLVAGVAWCYVDRDRRMSPAGTALLVAGTLLCLASLLVAVLLERRADGLVVPDGIRLPDPHWAGPAALTGLADLAGGLLAAPVMAFVGVAVLAAAAWGQAAALGQEAGFAPLRGEAAAEPPASGGYDRAEVVAARALAAFARRHRTGEGPALGTVQHLGNGRHRVVVVGADGVYGDAVVNGQSSAVRVAALAGLDTHDPDDRALGARARTGPDDWRRMGTTGRLRPLQWRAGFIRHEDDVPARAADASSPLRRRTL